MDIVLVTQYFWPEQFIINDLVKELANQGHRIYVLTGKPNYPSGNVFPGYTEHSTSQEDFIPGVSVFRVPLRPRGTGGAKNLFLNYLSFVYNGIKYFPKVLEGQHVDVILTFTISPITAIIPAIRIKKKTKAHLAIWLQDLWPESLEATGYIKNSFLLWLVRCMVRWIYFSSDTLLLQSKGFINQVKKLTKADKLFYYPNFFTLDKTVNHQESQLPLSLIETLENNSCFIFAGNLGKAQALDTLLDSVKHLTHLNKFKLIIVGSGSIEQHLQNRITKESLHQIVLAGHFPVEMMSQFFKRATALIVTLSNEKIFSDTIPSKIQAYLAAGKPIIASINGEGAQVINDSKAGLVCSAEDSLALSACIEKLYFMDDIDRDSLGKAARDYFVEHFEIKRQTERLVQLLNQRVAKLI